MSTLVIIEISGLRFDCGSVFGTSLTELDIPSLLFMTCNHILIFLGFVNLLLKGKKMKGEEKLEVQGYKEAEKGK